MGLIWWIEFGNNTETEGFHLVLEPKPVCIKPENHCSAFVVVLVELIYLTEYLLNSFQSCLCMCQSSYKADHLLDNIIS